MNSKWHFWISIVKSIIRIIGCVVAAILVPISGIKFAAFLFAIAEVLGIAEEIKDER